VARPLRAREAKTVSSLNHRDICTPLDVGEEQGSHFLVMEHLEGETLTQRLARGALLLGEVLRHAAEIAEPERLSPRGR
jgi:serine/threonine protein kinase